MTAWALALQGLHHFKVSLTYAIFLSLEESILKPLEKKTLSEKLFLLRFRVDSVSHLIPDKDVCRDCDKRACLFVCPADVYKWDERKGEIIVGYEGCLECGACRIACPQGVIEWRNPRGGYGVSYRFG